MFFKELIDFDNQNNQDPTLKVNDDFFAWNSSNFLDEIFYYNTNLNFIQLIHRYLPKQKLPINYKKGKENYNLIFSHSDKYFIPFYMELKQNFDFILNPKYVSIENSENFFFVLRDYKQKIGKSLKDSIDLACVYIKHDFLFNLLQEENIIKEEVIELILEHIMHKDNSLDEDFTKLINFIIDYYKESNLELIIPKTTDKKTKLMIENLILSKKIAKEKKSVIKTKRL